jgi:tetratricopeptide (TPR) repeat protein
MLAFPQAAPRAPANSRSPESSVGATDQANRVSFQDAVRHHRAGRLREAISAYENLLRRTPDDADILQLLGVALAQLDRHADGVRFLARSVELEPNRTSVLLNLARALHTLGREAEALEVCNRALALDASLAGAYQTRAAALAALGRADEALANHAEAVRFAPTDAGALTDLGVALSAGGRHQDALACFDRALELDPDLLAALHNRGVLAARAGQHERALQSFDRAITLQPHSAELHCHRGNTLKELGRLSEAVDSYALALALEPGSIDYRHNRAVAHSLLGRYAEALCDYDEVLARDPDRAADLIGRGRALVQLRRHSEALEPLERALALRPDDLTAHAQRGVALMRLDRHAEALASFERALAIEPDLPEVLNNRGICLHAFDRYEEALVSFERSLALRGATADTYTNIGVLLRSSGRYSEAIDSFERTLARKPGDPSARFALAFVHLTLGNFSEGWPLYEARIDDPSLGATRRDFTVPRWTGREALAGKTLLVHAEQGLGDTMQFCRYVPMLAARGIDVVFEVMPQLKALMHTLPGNHRLSARGEPPPPFDYQCPLLSLPLALATDLGSIPSQTPYLAVDPQRAAHWNSLIRAIAGLRVGIAWQGNPHVERLVWARGRSMPLAALAPLAKIPGVSLVSLQKGAGSEQLKDAGFQVIDLGPQFDAGADAFLDTAAVVSALDLVISTDTSVAHLAGALARPVWTALPVVPEWRWLLDRSDSPWYPTMRLFRQTRRGDWESVVAALAAALEPLAADRARCG